MRSWWFPPALVRTTEATPEQVVATGAGYGAYGAGGRDPIDGDYGYRPAGSAARREVPRWTHEKARTYSVASYRANPMARAIIDTYTSFCVGDSGVSLQVTSPEVRQVVEGFWSDPRNQLGNLQELLLRDMLLTGETLLEMLVGPLTGVVRFAPVDPAWVTEVSLVAGNALWPDKVHFDWAGQRGEARSLQVVTVDDMTGLRTGEAQWWTPFKALTSDRRSMPFLMPVLDWLDNYDTVLSNLIDRTALARYLVWDVTVEGGQEELDAYLEQRGGQHIPPSGSVEFHNQAVTWDAKRAETGAYEDTTANRAVLTNIASGAGLAKTWLAEPEDANRATSLTMAEPVRRRVQGVQKLWLGYQTELVRFAVDQAVAAKRLPATVTAADPRTRVALEIPAAQTVTVTGPEVAAADAQITAQVLLNLSTGLEKLVAIGALTREAAAVAARRAWEDFVGVPYTADLDRPDTDRDKVADAVDAAAKAKLRAVQPV